MSITYDNTVKYKLMPNDMYIMFMHEVLFEGLPFLTALYVYFIYNLLII